MHLRALSDRDEIAAFARRAARLHVYELGDLDAQLFPHTRYWGIGEPLVALCMLYEPSDPPTLLCLTEPDALAFAEDMLQELAPSLPRPLYAHLSPGLDAALPGAQESHGRHWKMALATPELLAARSDQPSLALGPEHRAELEALYARSTGDSWFAAWTLESGFYRGVRADGQLVAVAGVHVVSLEQRVAAIGNVVTDPAHRGQGLATRVTAATCRALLPIVDQIGLNVYSENRAAIACYEKLGFVKVGEYDELTLLG